MAKKSKCAFCDTPIKLGATYCRPCGQKKGNRLRNYGLSKAQYDLILKQQKNRCAICEQDFDGTPHVDHDHRRSYRYIRGLLCRNCNRDLGVLKDKKWRIQKILLYLEDPPAIKVLGKHLVPIRHHNFLKRLNHKNQAGWRNHESSNRASTLVRKKAEDGIVPNLRQQA